MGALYQDYFNVEGCQWEHSTTIILMSKVVNGSALQEYFNVAGCQWERSIRIIFLFIFMVNSSPDLFK